jgi:hypothetical protein
MINAIEIISVKTQSRGWLLNGNMLVPDAPGNSEREAILAWLAEGNIPESDTPTPEQLAQQAKTAVYGLLDQTAHKYDYRNFAEVVQFVNSNEWKAEADGLLAWQDAVWTKAYELLKAPIASVDAFVAQLPEYVPASGS